MNLLVYGGTDSDAQTLKDHLGLGSDWKAVGEEPQLDGRKFDRIVIVGLVPAAVRSLLGDALTIAGDLAWWPGSRGSLAKLTVVPRYPAA